MSLARYERKALADLLDELGPDAPTLCAGWTTRRLAAHLVARERRPDTLPGLVVPPLHRHTERVEESLAAKPYEDLVRRVRTGPGWLSPFGLPGADRFLNTTEYVVHHEDVRRAQPRWRPRELPDHVQDALWKVVAARAPLAFRGLPAGVRLHRAGDRPATLTPKKGQQYADVTGEPLEVLLYLFGRRGHALVHVEGDAAAIGKLKRADLSV